MGKSKIAESPAVRPRRPAPTPGPAERLRQLDPDLADTFDAFAATIDRQLDLTAATVDRDYRQAADDDPDEGVPPGRMLLDVEVELAEELGRLDLALDPLLEVAGRLAGVRDEGCAVLGRVEQLIAQRMVEAMRLTPRPALTSSDEQALRQVRERATLELTRSGEIPKVVVP